MNDEKLRNIVETILLSAGRPLTLDQLLALFTGDTDQPDRQSLRRALATIAENWLSRGIELVEVSSGYRFQAKSGYAHWIQRLWTDRPARYSRALLETLAIIAYRQPVTRGEIEDIRGVAVSTSIIKTLTERDWIRVIGHREVPGRPGLYGTTKGFLDHFGLKHLEALPPLIEIRDLEQINPDLFGKSLEMSPTGLEEGGVQKPQEQSGNLQSNPIGSSKIRVVTGGQH